jgi:hypothetical protein
MTFRTSEMTQVFLIAVACSGAESGTAAIGPFADRLLLVERAGKAELQRANNMLHHLKPVSCGAVYLAQSCEIALHLPA